jgi:hypothetical protein
MPVFNIKQNDTAPSIEAELVISEGFTNLDNSNVCFSMRSQSGMLLVDRAEAVIVNTAAMRVRYDWKPGDTTKAGTHRAEFQVTYSNGATETFPNSEDILVKITPDVA